MGGPGPAEASRGSAQILDAPTKILNTHRHTHTQTQHNTTQQRHTTQHNGGSRTGWSWARGLAGRSMAQKQDMSNKLSRRAAPLAKFFWGQGWFAKVWAQNGLIKKGAKRRSGPKVVWAQNGVGQKWSEKQKTWKNKSKKENIPLPFTQNKK